MSDNSRANTLGGLTRMNSTNPYAPPRANVYDVNNAGENVLADRATRLVASILDGLIFGAMVYLPLIIGGVISGIVVGASGGKPSVSIIGFTGLLGLAGLIVWAWLTIKFVNANGQSIAKKMLGIKVVRADGSPVSLGRIFWIRNVANVLLSIIPFYGLIDALMIFGEPRRCIHDKLADTIVIKA
jgi:uncharacterized RDD family membrane protein YckC